jgi:peptidoglycan/LPS O-acetylase OafA/YrhL
MAKASEMFGISKEIRGKNISYRPELDGIRALSIIVVLLHHIGYLNGRGFLGVDIFFTLSGYLITQVLLATVARSGSLLGFYRRRVARLYPIMAISVLIATWVIGFNSAKDTKPILASLFYFKNFLHWGDLFGPFWSLSAEEQFYLIFPITLIFFFRFFNKRVLTGFLLLVIAGVWSYVLWKNYPDYSWNQDGVLNLALFRPTMILVGCAISLNYELARKIAARFRALLLIAFVALVAACIGYQFPGLAALATVLLILLLDSEVADVSDLSRGVSSFLSWKPVRTLGVLSYSIYIWHMPVIFMFYKKGVNPHDHVAEIFGIVLVLALISFYLIEVPLQGFLSGTKKSASLRGV